MPVRHCHLGFEFLLFSIVDCSTVKLGGKQQLWSMVVLSDGWTRQRTQITYLQVVNEQQREEVEEICRERDI